MIKFRDETCAKLGLDLIVHINEDGVRQASAHLLMAVQKHTDVMKTEGLKQALNKYKFDAAFGGARRDEENPAPKSACTHSGMNTTAGIRKSAT